jgi:hypothetical protein
VTRRRVERASLLGLASAAVALATDVLYLSVINSQGGPLNLDRVVVVAAAIAAAAAAAVAGSLARDPSVRVLFLSTAAAILIVWGWIGAFSIGVFLLLAGTLAVVAAARVDGARRGVALAAPVIAAAVLMLTFAALALT